MRTLAAAALGLAMLLVGLAGGYLATKAWVEAP